MRSFSGAFKPLRDLLFYFPYNFRSLNCTLHAQLHGNCNGSELVSAFWQTICRVIELMFCWTNAHCLVNGKLNKNSALRFLCFDASIAGTFKWNVHHYESFLFENRATHVKLQRMRHARNQSGVRNSERVHWILLTSCRIIHALIGTYCCV